MEELIYSIAEAAVEIYYWAMIIYIISSWIPALRDNAFGDFLGKLVEPYLSIFRKIIPPFGMIDISPILAFIAYRYISSFALMGLQSVLSWF